MESPGFRPRRIAIKAPQARGTVEEPGAGRPPRALLMTMAAMKGRSVAASSVMRCSNASVT
jgi:hypothetical protein